MGDNVTEELVDVADEAERKLLEELLALQEQGNLKPKDRYEIPPQDIPEQDPVERRDNVSEVALGYTEMQARLEAMRCLQCKTAPCVKGCPVQIRIRDFIAAIAAGDFREALHIIKENSLLPAVCGRVCPQEVQCQLTCTVGLKFKDPTKGVSIGRLERYQRRHSGCCTADGYESCRNWLGSRGYRCRR
jgi:glutamate synthase (NADPH/NADH) small chain